MKKLLLTTALILTASGAFGQTINAAGTGTASANSGSSSNSESGASAATGDSISAVYIDQRAPGKIRTEGVVRTEQGGTVTNKFAPAVAAPAMGSGHPCGLGNSLGISIIGGGVTGGATRVDDACLLAQMGYVPAAMQMIASRNPSACKALVASGAISERSYCGVQKGTVPAVSPGIYDRPAVNPASGTTAEQAGARPAATPVCAVKAGTTRTIVTNYPDRLACARKLGLS